VPIGEDFQSIRDVAHRVVREHGIENARQKRKWLARVCNVKRHSICDTLPSSQMLRISNAMFIDIDAGYSAAAGGSQVHRRATRAATDIQHMTVLAHVHQVCKSKPLGGGQPTALTDVFTERTVAHRSLGAALEVRVDVVVEIHRSALLLSPFIARCDGGLTWRRSLSSARLFYSRPDDDFRTAACIGSTRFGALGPASAFCTQRFAPKRGIWTRRWHRAETRAYVASARALGVALLLAAAGVSFAVGIADLRTSQLLAEGLVRTARVSGKHVERSRSWKHHYVDIEYRTSAGQIIRARDDVSSALYDRVKVGDTITVRYLRAEPDVHALGRTPRPDTFMLWLAFLWLVLSGVYWLFGT